MGGFKPVTPLREAYRRDIPHSTPLREAYREGYPPYHTPQGG